MAYLAVEGDRRVYYERHEGTGSPVVLVHGWGANARCWDTVAPALHQAGHQVVLLDLRTCGRSDNDFTDVTITAMGSDVAALCRHLGLRRPVINGWSLGGAVAVDAVSRLGPDAAGLVLTGGATPRYTAVADWPHGGTVADVEGVLAATAADRASTLKGVAQAVCAGEQPTELIDWLWGMFLEMGPRGDASLRDLAHLDQRDTLAGLRVPVLLLHGNADGFVAFSGAKAAKDLCADGRLVEFPDCGHAPFLEDRETYLAELTRFVDR